MGQATKVAPCVDFGTNLFCKLLGMEACPVSLGLCVENHEWLDKWDW
jgi:hypothetical protein